jgi:hypothetical protein
MTNRIHGSTKICGFTVTTSDAYRSVSNLQTQILEEQHISILQGIVTYCLAIYKGLVGAGDGIPLPIGIILWDYTEKKLCVELQLHFHC